MRVRRWIGAATVLGIVGSAGFVVAWSVVPVDTVGDVDFAHELAIPPLAESEVDEDGTRVFDLVPQEGTTKFGDDSELRTWGFNGSYLGPTIRADRGEDVKVNVTNELDEDTTVHWHGMHLPAEMDGGPHQMVAPGETWSPTWTLDQEAATLWYHPHPHGKTHDHVVRGLAGMFLVDDPGNPAAAALPHEYGVDDVPLIVQDRNLRRSGEMNTGTNGQEILVNGTVGPYLDVTTESVRFRVLNASAERVYNFGFADDREFAVIGSDGGLLSSPTDTTRLQLGPGERAEIVVEMSPGEETVLQSDGPELGDHWPFGRFNGENDRFDILELRAADNLKSVGEVPEELASAPDLLEDEDHASRPDRRFDLNNNSQINGKSMDMSRIDEVVEVDTTEVWEVENTSGTYHPFHVHDVQFQVLDINGRKPPPEFAGWKDTVFLAPGDVVRIAMEFTDYTNPDVPYMMHCHRLRHEDNGMMGQFVVVAPGEKPGDLDEHHH